MTFNLHKHIQMNIKRLLLALVIIASNSLFSQIIMPQFDKSVMVNEFKDKGETSNIQLYNEGNNIFFYRIFLKGEGDKTRLLRQNVWYSERNGEQWSKIDRLFTEESYPGENVVIGTSNNGDRIYIFQNQFKAPNSFERKIGYRELNEEGEWNDFVEITIPGFTLEEKYYYLKMNSTGNVLLLSMSTDESPGQEDLFVSYKKDGNWLAPKNLGPIINTSRSESSPFLDTDERTLYFASEGHGGNGGTDIYVSYRLDDTWQNWTIPINLGDNINTSDYEENFVHAGNGEYYYTSNQNDEHTNIYFTSSDQLLSIASNQALLYKDKKPLSEITIHVLDPNGQLIDDETTDSNGSINHIRLDQNHVYQYVMIEDDPNLKGSKFYLLDNGGECLYRLVADENNRLVDDLAFPTVEKVKGKIDGLSNGRIEIVDENGYTIQTVSSDENGSFSFRRSYTDAILTLNYEGNGKITSLKSTDFAKREKDLLKVVKGKSIHFNQWEDKKIAALGETKPAASLDKQTVSKAKENILKGSTSNLVDRTTIYFDFNQLLCSYSESKKVKEIAKSILNDTPSQVRVIGHTDPNGSEEINYRVAEERANSIKRMLQKEGVQAEIIIVISKGEKELVNKMIDAKNRRVVIQY